MADYMIQISYSAAAWVALIAKPENRLEAVEKVGEKLGGKVGSFWFSFGDHEGDSPSSSLGSGSGQLLSCGTPVRGSHLVGVGV